MTPTEPEYRAILRSDFVTFVERSFYELNPHKKLLLGPHIEIIVSKLDECRLGKIKRLIINIPPRNLKSHCASICFPAWLLGHIPTAEIICASYGQDLAEKFARDTRKLMASEFYERTFRTRLSERQLVNDFETTKGGIRKATSVGGVLTGRGADFIILDDPIKPDDALSRTQRQSVNEWYANTLLSRLNSKMSGCIVIIMQRLHQDDLIGHVLQEEGWDQVSFAAIAERNAHYEWQSLFGIRRFTRQSGEALHPDHEPLSELKKMRSAVGEYNFSAQYQQRPIPEGGAIVKTDWLKYYSPGEEPAQYDLKLQSWDTANKSNELSNYSVCTTWGYKKRQLYLLHVFREKLNYPELKRAVRDHADRYRPDKIVIEDKASGTQLIQELKAGGIFGIEAYEPPAGVDKIMRLHAQTPYFNDGCVHLPKNALWLTDYVHEITGFPGTTYNDQVDSTTQALAYIRIFDSGLGLFLRAFGDD